MSDSPSPVKVLIAEDDVVSRRLLEKQTTGWGYTVLTAKDGGEAWRAFQDNDIGIAIIDWMMPEINGIELCRRIRSHRSGRYTYIILLTSKTQRKDMETGFKAGVDDYIRKPFDPLELKARLKTGKRIIDLLAQLHRLAIRDDLTQLLNRGEILRILAEEFERSKREGMPLSLIMLDIDRFKRINDTFGHPVGDEVLVELSKRLRGNKRSYDKVGRYGGEEILILLPYNTYSQTRAIAERYRSLIRDRTFSTKAGEIRVTASLGCSSSEVRGIDSVRTLIERADQALYHAKHEGRDRVEIDPGPSGENTE